MTKRISFSLDSELLERFEHLRSKLGINQRSHAIQQALREFISARSWELGEKGMAVVALVYDRDQADPGITEIQHRFRSCIRSELHQHLDSRRCLELMLVEGNRSQLELLVGELARAKGTHSLKLVQIE